MSNFDISKLDVGNSKPKEEKQTSNVKNVVPAASKPKRSNVAKLFDSFSFNDVSTVKDSIVKEFLIPGLKETALNAFRMFLYRDSDPRMFSNGNGTPYNSMFNKPKQTGTSQNNFDYKKLEWNTKGEAQRALFELQEILDRFKKVRVAELFEIADKTPPGDSTGNNYGWTDLEGSEVLRTMWGTYVLKLPPATYIR